MLNGSLPSDYVVPRAVEAGLSGRDDPSGVIRGIAPPQAPTCPKCGGVLRNVSNAMLCANHGQVR
jgi:hypothetical protein